MQKPIIAIDIDDVLTHSAEAVIEFSNTRWSAGVTLDDYDEDWRKLWGLTAPEQEAEMHRRAQEIRDAEVIGEGLIPRQGAERVLNLLRQNARVFAVTSRRRAVEPATRRWVEKHFGNAIEEFHFAGIYDDDSKRHSTLDSRIAATKHDILSRVCPDYFIDDQVKHCEAALKLGIKTIIFGDYLWNKDINIEREGAVRCANWRDVEKYFKAQGLV